MIFLKNNILIIVTALLLAMGFGCLPVHSSSSMTVATSESDNAQLKAEAAAKPTPASVLDKQITFSFRNMSIDSIIRKMNVISEVDMGVAPELLKRIQKSNRTFYLHGSNLKLRVFLDWVSRLMDCTYVDAVDPDIWFVDERLWLEKTTLEWQGHENTLFVQNDGGAGGMQLAAELQRGLSWLRPEARVLPGRMDRWIMVNSTRQGHKRIRQLMSILADRNYIPFEKISAYNELSLKSFMGKIIATPEDDIGLHQLVERIVINAGLNIGYDGSLYPAAAPPRISVPLDSYRVAVLLDKIMGSTSYRSLHIDDTNALWLSTKNQSIVRDGRIAWETMDLYVFSIRSVTKRIRGEPLVAAIKKSINAETWLEPATVIHYLAPFDLLVIINRPQVVEGVLRYLHSLKMFGNIPTEVSK